MDDDFLGCRCVELIAVDGEQIEMCWWGIFEAVIGDKRITDQELSHVRIVKTHFPESDFGPMIIHGLYDG